MALEAAILMKLLLPLSEKDKDINKDITIPSVYCIESNRMLKLVALINSDLGSDPETTLHLALREYEYYFGPTRPPENTTLVKLNKSDRVGRFDNCTYYVYNKTLGFGVTSNGYVFKGEFDMIKLQSSFDYNPCR